MKELWLEFYEDALEMGKEPDDAAAYADSKCIDWMADAADAAKNRRKEGSL